MATNSLIVTGGQYGSEGKGAFIHHIANDYDYHVRVGGPQAGHSAKIRTVSGDEVVFKARTVPVGALSGKIGLIGMASVINLDVLQSELNWLDGHGINPVVHVDGRATILDRGNHIRDEQEQELVGRIGSTGKGVGAARASRIMRTAATAADCFDTLDSLGVHVVDTSAYLRDALGNDATVLVEAAQGQHLSLFSGGFYPFCTSTECGPTQAFADLGLPLRYARQFESCGVFRAYPIRVAGNSGPLYGELSWADLIDRHGGHIPVERTTVTDKVRRVGEWDQRAARMSAIQTGIDWAVLSFLDYPFPLATGCTDWDGLEAKAQKYVRSREKDLGVLIDWVGTSFGTYARVPL